MVRLFMEPPYNQAVDQALASAQIPEGRRAAIRAELVAQLSAPVPVSQVLSAGGRRLWFEAWDPSAGYYWPRQRQYLVARLHRSPVEMESLDNATDTILAHLEDPRPEGPPNFNVRGLVVGHIQSGKTANFSALIAKATDVGYKLVIVLSGIHNALRQQTQRRLARELGLVGGGVGIPEPGRQWVAFTTDELTGDFHAGNANAAVLQGNERVLLVVKKNATVLRRLIQWMGGNVPAPLPVLIIDDEADQASINTGANRPPLEEVADLNADDLEGNNREDELNPSVINGLIRQLLASFRRVSYVAYTATPFANVLINHEAMDREVLEDLYPRDFIISLPRPVGYVGADRLFGRGALAGETEDVTGLDVIEIVPELDVDMLAPLEGLENFDPELPPSLRTAFLDFVLAIAGRALRSGNLDFAASMLVHTHHRTRVQNRVAELVRQHLDQLRQQWRYDRESIRHALRERWETRFRPLVREVNAANDATFEQVEEQITQLLRNPLTVLVLNSESDDVLDHDADPRLKAVLIGGNRLSRGLTLEGLLVSYFVRRTYYFDTLLQMGRWFGYREDYLDLTRLTTTEELAGLFRDVALAEEELRREIARYERERLTPLDFGPRIRCHPAMLITSRAKMGSGQLTAVSYAAQLVQTINFRLDSPPWLERNLDATKRFLSSLGPPERVERARYIWSRVDARRVVDFLADYQSDPRNTFIDAPMLREYIARQNNQDELVRWYVCVVSQTRGGPLGDEDLGVEGHRAIHTIGRAQLARRVGSIGVLVNPASAAGEPGTGDEEVGLTRPQLVQARANVTGQFPLGQALRSERDPAEGLLLIYPVSRESRPRRGSKRRIPLFEDPGRNGRTVVGVAMVFPASRSDATLEYIEGSVNIRRARDG
jgi:hypothetical protein